jgi:nitrate/TMAO reductase-like tetraheme cytochrome c subunit
MVGLGLLLTSIVMWACLITVELRHGDENPYIGLATIAVAALFVLGLLITPLGLHLGRRRLRKVVAHAETSRTFAWRRLIVFLAVVSLVNLAVASQLTLRGLHQMESRQFCGTTCHVMTPEARAFTQGPHAGILCVDCHVGEGAVGLVKSKIQGTHQLIAVITDNIPKPIKGAIESGLMVPSAETCEQCHWKERPAKATVKLIPHYGEDVANTATATLLTMNIGGSAMGGIHGAHNEAGVEIRFVATDPKRADIPLVEYRNSKTNVTRTYVKAGVDAAALANAPRITMQCFDCHNRPAHAFEAPERALDRAIALGRLSAALPFVKKAGLEILKAGYADSAAAATAIPAALAAFYEKSHPDAAKAKSAEIEEAGRVLVDLYSHNVFPELGVDWGTYVNYNGHQTSPGCFRCHDGEHVASSGEKITNDCFKCHFPSAVEEANPQVLKLLGVDTMMKKLEKR